MICGGKEDDVAVWIAGYCYLARHCNLVVDFKVRREVEEGVDEMGNPREL